MKPENLKKRILKKSGDCAILLGNGINNFAEIGCSWMTLLQQLYEHFLPDTPFKGVPKGITYTEFFDALEISILEQTKVFEPKNFKPLDFNLDSTRANEVFKEIQKFSLKESFKIDAPKVTETLETFKKESLKFNEDGGTSLLLALSTLGDKFKNAVNSDLIRYICQTMSKWDFSEIHSRFANFAQTYNIPILTTNYDNLLAKSINAHYFNFGNNKVDEALPITSCYTTQSSPDINKFAIWHPNGMLRYPKSILIGLSHYMRNLEAIRNKIIPSNKFKAELFEKIIFEPKTINNTWINHIFFKELFIVGLSLDTDEVLLRWLLIERAKLFSLYPIMHKDGWYIVTKRDYHRLTLGKKFFLKSIGFNIITMDDYQAMYNAFSE